MTRTRLVGLLGMFCGLLLVIAFANSDGWPFAVVFAVLSVLNGYQAWTGQSWWPGWRRRR